MKDIYGYYFTFLVHLLTLTIKINFNEIIEKSFNLNIPLDRINELFKNYTNLDKTMDTGNFNIISIINLIAFFLIGLNFSNLMLLIIVSFIILEGFTLYSEGESQIVTNIITAMIGYIFGMYFNNKRYFKRIEQNYYENSFINEDDEDILEY